MFSHALYQQLCQSTTALSTKHTNMPLGDQALTYPASAVLGNHFSKHSTVLKMYCTHDDIVTIGTWQADIRLLTGCRTDLSPFFCVMQPTINGHHAGPEHCQESALHQAEQEPRLMEPRTLSTYVHRTSHHACCKYEGSQDISYLQHTKIQNAVTKNHT